MKKKNTKLPNAITNYFIYKFTSKLNCDLKEKGSLSFCNILIYLNLILYSYSSCVDYCSLQMMNF